MIDFNQLGQSETPPDSELGVKVIGVGGAGANVVDRMALEGSEDAELLTLNTDVRALSTSVSTGKIQLGATLLKGMGTGGDPSLGKQAALEAVDEIRTAVREKGIIFLCVGLGGGTGSGAAPEVCRIAREEGVFLVVFATTPFSFEGSRRAEQARKALEVIGKYANAIITFDNDRMGELIVPKDGVTQAFAAADKIIGQSIRATMNVVFRPGIIRIGIDDLLSALDSKDSRCLFGYGVAKGDNRSHEAVEQALKCPLLDKGRLLDDANAVMVQVAGGDTMTLYEVQLVMEEVSKHVGDGTQILFGTGTDKRLGNSLSVTIISSIVGPGSGSISSAPEEEEEAPTVSLGGGEEEDQFSAMLQNEPEEEEEFSTDAAEADSDDDDSVILEPLGKLGEKEEGEDLLPIADSNIDDSEEEDGRNPIARAVEAASDDVTSSQPNDFSGDDEGDEGVEGVEGVEGFEGVEAVTDTEQKITLTRMVSDGTTGRIKARPSEDNEGTALSPQPEAEGDSEDEVDDIDDASEEAKQQQEMLQLEPISGKGRFAKTDPTIVDGEDLDVPTFLRKKK